MASSRGYLLFVPLPEEIEVNDCNAAPPLVESSDADTYRERPR